MTRGYLIKTKPYAHQPIGLDMAYGRRAFAYTMEQGTGKTWMAIVEASTLWARGQIGAMIVVAPNDVHRQWVTQQIPEHCAVPHRAAYWVASPLKAERLKWEVLWQAKFDGLRIFVFNVEAFQRAGSRAAKELRKVLNALPTYLALDESSRIKTPGATRTKVLVALGKHAKYRRILSGTPLTNSPLDAYSQFRFLDPKIMGYSSFSAFKHHFAEWEKRRTSNNRQGWYEKLVGYRNLDELGRKIAAHSYRVRKVDCLDLPPKIYETRTVRLTAEQRRIYNELVEDGVSRLGGPKLTAGSDRDDALWALMMDEDGVVRGQIALTVLLRLQQVVGGWVTDEEGTVREIPGGNPKLEALLRYADELDGKALVWSSRVPEIRAIVEALRARNEGVVAYYGEISRDDRAEARRQFQEDLAVRWFVGNPHAGGIGLNLTGATTVLYYSTDHSYEKRAQSEDRAHRIGQTRSVLYVDFVAEETVDEKIADALFQKRQMAEEILDGGTNGDDQVPERVLGGGGDISGGAGAVDPTDSIGEAGRTDVCAFQDDGESGVFHPDGGEHGYCRKTDREARFVNVELSGEFLHETDAALKVDFDGDGEGTWLPKSQLLDVTPPPRTLNPGDLIEVEIPEWLAVEKGLV